MSVGASVAWAGHAAQPDERWWRSSALWALLTLELMVMAPMSTFIVHRYPAWSSLYLLEAAPLTPWLEVIAAALGLGFALAGFITVRALLGRRKQWVASAVVPVGLLVAAAIVLAAARPLSLVGTRAAYVANTTKVRPITDTALIYLVCAAGIAYLVAWGATSWRLMLIGRAGKGRSSGGRRPVQDHPGTDPALAPSKRAKRGS